jgi:hypothetical protein
LNAGETLHDLIAVTMVGGAAKPLPLTSHDDETDHAFSGPLRECRLECLVGMAQLFQP